MYNNICKICGKEFECINEKTKCCSERCREEHKRRFNSEWKRKQIELRNKPKVRKSALSAMTAEIARYNKKHGTNLSYGKYVMLKERGEL